MASGLLALLDDIAALARVAAASLDDIAAGAAKAGSKAIGVVIDDTAVTPQYVDGLSPSRELPIIKRIFVGSLRNKLVFIVPVALLLSQFAPWLLTPLLMLGGTYLAYEGAHKVIDKLRRGGETKKDAPAAVQGPEAEDRIVKEATTTDFILSAEIMVISLNEVADEVLWMRAVILILVAIGITVLVYGVVAILVKMDDVGVWLAKKRNSAVAAFGRGLFAAMPKLMSAITAVGTVAMLWVGGHIVLVGLDELVWAGPLELGHAITNALGATGFFAWLIDTAYSALFGLVWRALVVGIVALLPFGHKEEPVKIEQGDDGHLHALKR
ncbi:DUF808 domain-containing protein [Trueperella bialowiezensis]|uniref:Inner membrane protein yedI n=1 Tax=Trueperella bialowiezensis TaxID=312285 RepID=A0A3S4V5U3_9ACTO|nr:DUF808 domain-containing protein [Trueperella bialowiezensis]VEI12732.1 Inner membrane protein yedI [Trueperella bialowiezensis]